MGDILKWCANHKKAYHVVSKEDLEKITLSVHHEGVALVAKRKINLSETELFTKLQKVRQPLIVLDAVMNPHNIGSIMRIMAHFGWKYLVCDEQHAVPMSASAARMSEGGSEYVDYIAYRDQSEFLKKLKSLSYQTIGTSTHGRKSFYATPLNTQSCAFFLGNEVAGLSKDLMKKLDVVVAIPSVGEVQSLNVAMATTLLIGECVRQNGLKK
jgi:TrmH RNA methyltransferase